LKNQKEKYFDFFTFLERGKNRKHVALDFYIKKYFFEMTSKCTSSPPISVRDKKLIISPYISQK